MSLWWLLVPAGTVTAFVVVMVCLGLLVERSEEFSSVDEFADFRNALRGGA